MVYTIAWLVFLVVTGLVWLACGWFLFFVLIIFYFLFLGAWFKFLLIFNFMIFIDFNLYFIFTLFFFLFLSLYYFLHEETVAIYLEGESTEFWKNEILFFRRIAHILFLWGNRLEKGKKIRKESRFKKGRNEEIFLQQIWEVSLGRLIYIRERGRKTVQEDFWMVRGRKAHEDGRWAITADFVQVCFWLLWVFWPIFDFFILVI